MPVKARAAKDRSPSFSAEALALFLELERTPKGSQRFKDGSRELARMLGLIDQWWSGQHVSASQLGDDEGYARFVAGKDVARVSFWRRLLIAVMDGRQRKADEFTKEYLRMHRDEEARARARFLSKPEGRNASRRPSSGA
jgi:hypothetical protein